MVLLERVEFLNDTGADHAHAVQDVLVEEFDRGLVGLLLAMAQQMVVKQSEDHKNSGEGEDWVEEPDFLDEHDKQAEIEKAELDQGLVGVEGLKSRDFHCYYGYFTIYILFLLKSYTNTIKDKS